MKLERRHENAQYEYFVTDECADLLCRERNNGRWTWNDIELEQAGEVEEEYSRTSWATVNFSDISTEITIESRPERFQIPQKVISYAAALSLEKFLEKVIGHSPIEGDRFEITIRLNKD